MQNLFQRWHNVSFFELEESEVVARKSSVKKVFLKIPQNSQENICPRVSLQYLFCKRLQKHASEE